MKTAILLLLLVAGASILGTVIKQNASQQEYIKAYGQLGYAVIRSFNLDDVYRSAWYILLLLLLALNLTVCTFKRFSSTWRRTFAPRIIVDPREILSYPKSRCFTRAEVSADEVISSASLVLKKKGYNVKSAASGSSSFIYAVKGRLGMWGPYITHLSILVIFIGAVIGVFFGSRGTMMIAEGRSSDSYWSNSSPQPVELGFSIHLSKFRILTDLQRRPTAYRSYVEVREGGRLKRKGIIDVNRPLLYKGFAFYQSSYGLEGFVVHVESPHGGAAWVEFGLASFRSPEDLLKSIEIDGKRLSLYVHNAVPDYVAGEAVNATDMPLNPACDLLVTDKIEEASGMSGWKRLGWLQIGDSVDYKGYRIRLAKAIKYTVLEVSRNPGLPIVYAGFALVVAGVFLSFYVPRRELRLCADEQDGETIVTLGCPARSANEATEEDIGFVLNAICVEDAKEER